MDEKFLKNYYKKVRKELKCPRKMKKEILANMKSDIEEYFAEFPDETESGFIDRFGEPKQYAKIYITTLNNDVLKKKLSRNVFGLRLWLFSIIIMLLIFIAVLIGMIRWNKRTTPVFYTQEIVYESQLQK